MFVASPKTSQGIEALQVLLTSNLDVTKARKDDKSLLHKRLQFVNILYIDTYFCIEAVVGGVLASWACIWCSSVTSSLLGAIVLKRHAPTLFLPELPQSPQILQESHPGALSNPAHRHSYPTLS